MNILKRTIPPWPITILVLAICLTPSLVLRFDVHQNYDSNWFLTISVATTILLAFYLIFYLAVQISNSLICYLKGPPKLRKQLIKDFKKGRFLLFIPELYILESQKPELIIFPNNHSNNPSSQPAKRINESICISDNKINIYPDIEMTLDPGEDAQILNICEYRKVFFEDNLTVINSIIAEKLSCSDSEAVFEEFRALTVRIDSLLKDRALTSYWKNWVYNIDTTKTEAVFLPNLSFIKEEYKRTRIISSRKDLDNYRKDLKNMPEAKDIDLKKLDDPKLDKFCEQLEKLALLEELITSR